MKFQFCLLIVLAFLAVFSSKSNASSCLGKARFYGNFQISSSAFNDKEVEGITLKAAVLINSQQGTATFTSWVDQKEIEMQKQNTLYFAKAVLNSGYGIHANGSQHRVSGLFVEYHVRFKDGSTTTIKPSFESTLIDLNQNHTPPEAEAILRKIDLEFTKAESTDQNTMAGYLYNYHC